MATSIDQVEANKDVIRRYLIFRGYQLKFVLSSLDRYIGNRVRVRGLLIGEGGLDGINVSFTESIAKSCK